MTDVPDSPSKNLRSRSGAADARAVSTQPSWSSIRRTSPRNSPSLTAADDGKAIPPLSAEQPSKPSSDHASKTKYYKMLVRTGVAFGGMFLSTATMMSDHIYLIIAIAIIQTIVFYELVAVRQDVKLETRKIPFFRSLNWFAYGVSMFFAYGKDVANFYGFSLLQQYHFYLVFCMYIALFVLFVSQLALVASREGQDVDKKHIYKYCFKQLSWTLLIIFLIVFQLAFVMQHILEGVFWFFLPCSCVIMNDTSAYFCGFFMGKKFIKQPLTALSPNKTWEGFVGAVFCTLAWAWFVTDLLSTWPWFICPRRHYEVDAHHCTPPEVFVTTTYDTPIGPLTCRPAQLHMLLIALFASLIAPFGGFLASAIKRAYGIKDFGSVIPGHGGFTDRMDCQFLMLFCAHIHYRTFIRVLPFTVYELSRAISVLAPADQLSLLKELEGSLQDRGLT